MDINNMKNMVVLKNLPSNLIEEAFIVLKDNVKVHREELAVKNKTKNDKINNNLKSKDYVIKEAEMIVHEYVSKIEKKEYKGTKDKIKLEEKCKRFKFATIFFAVVSMCSVIGLFIK